MKERFRLVPAVYVILRRGQQILLIRRFQTGYHDGEYSLPAGHVEGEESALNAAIREVREEVGVALRPEDVGFVHVMHRRSDDPVRHERMDLYFEVTNWKGEPINAEPNKCDELCWADVAELPAAMVPEVRAALQGIAAGKIYSDYRFD